MILSNIKNVQYEDNTVNPNKYYFYKIKAVLRKKESALSQIDSGYAGTLPIKPSAPATLSASDNDPSDRIIVTWDGVVGAESYSLYRSQSESGPYSQINSTCNTTRFEDIACNSSRYYFYKVKAVNQTGESDFSANDSGYRVSMPSGPDYPVNLKAISGVSNITISWLPVPGALNYAIYRKGPFDSNYSLLKKEITDQVYEDANVSINMFYYYKVSAYFQGEVESRLSDPVQGFVNLYPVTPEPPHNVRVLNGKTSITISWDPVGYAYYYKVYRSENSDKNFELLIDNCTDLSIIDGAIESKKYYYYKVSSVNILGESFLSNCAEGVIGSSIYVLAIPKNVKSFPSVSSINLSWDKTTNATFYRIYRSTNYNDDYSLLVDTIKTTTYIDSIIDTNKVYYYKVAGVRVIEVSRGCNKILEYINSEMSEIVYGYIGSSTPLIGIPAGVEVTTGDYQNKIHLSWDAVAGASYYEIYKSNYSNECYYPIIKTRNLSFDDANVIQNTIYYYKIVAYNPYSGGDISQIVAGYAGDSPSIPNRPTGVTASKGIYTNIILITWDSIAGAEYYKIYRSETNDNFTLLSPDDDSLKSPIYNDASIQNNKKYYYEIQAFNIIGESIISDYDFGYIGELH